MSNSGKRYWWLKLPDGFFEKITTKGLKFRGPQYVVVYLELLLESVKTDGRLIYRKIAKDIATELSMAINEDVNLVRQVILYLEQQGLAAADPDDPDNIVLLEAVDNLGSKGDSAERMKRYRAKQRAGSNNDKQ